MWVDPIRLRLGDPVYGSLLRLFDGDIYDFRHGVVVGTRGDSRGEFLGLCFFLLRKSILSGQGSAKKLALDFVLI
jgi:hypothetical protein